MATVDRVCVLVVSHNLSGLTDELCREITIRTHVPYDLHVIETGSDLDKCSKYMTLRTKDKIRMTRGWNVLRDYADRLVRISKRRYAAYQLFVNDAKWVGDHDMITTLYRQMMSTSDCGQIHPYQTNIRDAGHLLRRCGPPGIRKVSFSEIVCPMIRAEAWARCPDLLDDRFFYGWGLDYDIPYQLAKVGYRCYVSDSVGITHHAGTTAHNRQVTNEKPFHVVQDESRENMYAGMWDKYGEGWPYILLESVPKDVSPEALHDWLVNSEQSYMTGLQKWKEQHLELFRTAAT
jgi:hypothetical protein